MRILQLCKKSPTPQKDGESVAIHQISKSLRAKGHELDVLAMLTAKHPSFDEAGELPNASYTYVTIDSNTSIWGALKSIFTKDPYIVERFTQNDFLLALIEKLNEKKFDLVICEGIFLGPYLETIRTYSQAKVLLRAHNVEHVIWKRWAKESSSGLKKLYLNRVMIPQFKQFEDYTIKKVDAIIPISPVDAKYFDNLSKKPKLLVPVAMEHFRPCELPNTFSVGFIGGMDWQPNIDGLIWFLNNVWTPFVKEHKDVQLEIAGRNMSKDMLKWDYPNTNILGEIEDSKEFIRKQSLIIAPIFSGSGMRVKIIEAMSQGKCMLSTPIGAEGIALKDEVHALLKNDADEWIEALENVLANPNKLMDMGNASMQLAKEKYSLSNYSGKLDQFISKL